MTETRRSRDSRRHAEITRPARGVYIIKLTRVGRLVSTMHMSQASSMIGARRIARDWTTA